MELYSPNWCIGAGLENAAINRNIETTAIVLLVHLDKSGRGAHPYLREGSSDSGSENADAEQDKGILSTGSDESAHASVFSQILDEVISVVYQAFSTSSWVPVMASELANLGNFGHPKRLAREFRLLSARNAPPAKTNGETKTRYEPGPGALRGGEEGIGPEVQGRHR